MLLPEKNTWMLFKIQVLSSLLSMFISFSQVPGTVANILPRDPNIGKKAQFSQAEQGKEQTGSFNFSEYRIDPPHPGHE